MGAGRYERQATSTALRKFYINLNVIKCNVFCRGRCPTGQIFLNLKNALLNGDPVFVNLG